MSSQQTGPSWYPSKQFVHSPEPPTGAPSAPVASGDREPKPGVVRRLLNRLLAR